MKRIFRTITAVTAGLLAAVFCSMAVLAADSKTDLVEIYSLTTMLRFSLVNESIPEPEMEFVVEEINETGYSGTITPEAVTPMAYTEVTADVDTEIFVKVPGTGSSKVIYVFTYDEDWSLAGEGKAPVTSFDSKAGTFPAAVYMANSKDAAGGITDEKSPATGSVVHWVLPGSFAAAAVGGAALCLLRRKR